MESRAKLFGHAIDPILIVYPLGLLSTAVVFDIIYLVTGDPRWATISFWILAAGLVGGVLSALFAFIDYLNNPTETRAKRIGLPHGLTNVCVMLLFSISWWLRWLARQRAGERLGVGVAEGANLNAPNSMTQPHRNELRVDRKTVRHA